jgi:hypothetical protein
MADEEDCGMPFEPCDQIAERMEAFVHVVDCLARLPKSEKELRESGLQFLDAVKLSLTPAEKAKVLPFVKGKAL